jgi:ribosomal protein S18 acetylase RimI-like enzyme
MSHRSTTVWSRRRRLLARVAGRHDARCRQGVFMPRDVWVRDGGADDARSIAEVHVDGWRWGYRELVPEGVLDGLSVDEFAQQWTQRFARLSENSFVLVAERRARVVGFALAGRPGPGQDLPAGTAQLHYLYVKKHVAGTGIGRALMNAVIGRVQCGGYTRLSVWVLKDNGRARRFYEAAGFQPDGTEEDHPHPTVPIVMHSVRYIRRLTENVGAESDA